MTLVSRLTAFFLAALAVVLLGFSLGLYLFMWRDLNQHLEDHLRAAVGTLTAAVEIEANGLKWQPTERRLWLTDDPNAPPVLWTVRNERGVVIDRSPDLNPYDVPALTASDARDATEHGPTVSPDRQWLLAQTQLTAPEAVTPDWTPEDPADFAALTISAAVSRQPVQRTLHRLALVLGSLSLTGLVLAAGLGRAFSRRALRPLARMAKTAHSITAADLDARLDVPRSRDELQELSQAFNGALDRMQDALERQRQFAGNASHQLRTPLTAILGQLDVCLRRPRGTDEYRNVLQTVRSETHDLQRLVEALLFLARADAESELPDLREIDLAAWARGYMRRWTSHARAADVRLLGDTDGPLPIRAHAVLLEQLLENLLDNAVKYTEPGTPIAVTLARDAGGVLLTVEDRGPGLTADELPHLFKPFYRSPRSAASKGTGLGLPLAQRIVRTFGGTIHVQATPGQGCRFDVHFPNPTPTAR